MRSLVVWFVDVVAWATGRAIDAAYDLFDDDDA